MEICTRSAYTDRTYAQSAYIKGTFVKDAKIGDAKIISIGIFIIYGSFYKSSKFSVSCPKLLTKSISKIPVRFGLGS